MIDFENLFFFVNSELCLWEWCEYFWCVGISVFGVGGMNVYVIVEEWNFEE